MIYFLISFHNKNVTNDPRKVKFVSFYMKLYEEARELITFVAAISEVEKNNENRTTIQSTHAKNKTAS